jgi:hypothetical protein
MDTSVEINTHIKSEFTNGLYTLEARVKAGGRIEPTNIRGAIHLHSFESLRQPRLAVMMSATVFAAKCSADKRLSFNISWSISTYPGIYPEFVPHFASEQLMDWEVDFPRYSKSTPDTDAVDSRPQTFEIP